MWFKRKKPGAYWSHPTGNDASYGHKDRHLAWLEAQTIVKELTNFGHSPKPDQLTDIGCGSTIILRSLMPMVRIEGWDKYPRSKVVRYADLESKLPIPDGSRSSVLCKRVLCNLEPQHREHAIRELKRIVAKSGRLIIVDVSAPRLANVNKARVQGGLKPLPARNEPLSVGLIDAMRRILPGLRENSIARNYYIWTRLTLPLMLGHDVPFDANAVRRAAPVYGKDADLLAVHRMWVWDRI